MSSEDTWSFAMATPDTVLAGQLDFVLDRLAAHGFEVTACRLLGLDVPRMLRMYTHSDDPRPLPPAPRTGKELPPAVIEQMYALAPACVLVVRRPKGEASPTLLRCKGATRPDEALPGSIRAAGENAILNLLHCPDDAASAAIELAYLVGPEWAAALRATRAPAVGVTALKAALPAFSGWEALSFPLVANRLRWRIVQHLAPHVALDLEDTCTALQAEREALLAASTPADRLRLAQHAHPGIHAPLRAAAQALGSHVVLEALDALAELYVPEGTRRLGPILALRSEDIYLSALEQMVLDAHRHAFWSDAHPLADVSD